MKLSFLIICFLLSVDCIAQTDTLTRLKVNDEGKSKTCLIPGGPNFPGGTLAMTKYIYDNLRIPRSMKHEPIKGKIFVQMIVDTLGNIRNPKVLRGINKAFDKEILRIFKSMPKWEPKEVDGKKVEDEFVMPFMMQLSGDKK